MASVGIKIQENVSKEIQSKINKLKDMSPFFGRAAIRMHRSVLLNFKAGGRPTKWPVSARAKAQGRTPDSFGATLVDTGLLRASIGFRVTRNSASIGMENVGERLKETQYRTVKRGAIIGSQVKYGRKHQEGIGVKQRKFILIQRDDEKALLRMLEKHLS